MTTVETFENELRVYGRYLNEANALRESIDDLYYQLSGVKGVDPFAEHGTPNSHEVNMRKHDLMDKIEILEREEKRRNEFMRMVANKLDMFGTFDRLLLIKRYVNRSSLLSIAIKYGYANASSVDYHCKKVIRDTLGDS